MRLLVVAALLLVGCGGDDGDGITVLAAASLADPLTELAAAFESTEGVDVALRFGGSSALVAQVNEGAPADVLVTADEVSMAAVDGPVDATIVARNRLAIAVERGNPKGITGLDDLDRADVVVVLCAPDVPCGRLGALALDRAGVDADPASLEENVKGVVSKVALGEADAGIVYATDVRGADAVALDVDDRDLEAAYPMTVVDGSDHADVARAWVDFVAGPDGRAVLVAHGFLEP